MGAKIRLWVIIGVIIVLGAGGAITYALIHKGQATSDMPGMEMDHSHSMMNMDMSDTDSSNTNSVTVRNYSFSPSKITVKVGTKVTWTNQDQVQHTVTFDGSSPVKTSSKLFGNGESYSYTFAKPGTYTYHCDPHPYMKGTVVVTN